MERQTDGIKPVFTRHIEQSYETMYERYQAGLPPENIYVSGEQKPLRQPPGP